MGDGTEPVVIGASCDESECGSFSVPGAMQVTAWFGGFAPPAPLPLPVLELDPVSWGQALFAYPPLKALLPLPILIAMAPVFVWFFRSTWREIDAEAARERAGSAGAPDYRPAVCMLLTAVVLTVQEYYGGRQFFQHTLRPELERLSAGPWQWLAFERYEELYAYGWWCFSRSVGYVVPPLLAWKLLFPKDSILDMGLRIRGFVQHLWVYGVCLAIVIPTMLLVAQQPDFGSYYPFYKQSSRSVFDFVAWEAMYWVQFFALELFFRGWMVGALRHTMGSAAIFVMALPYCMIHYGKPYLEAHGAIVAGVVLGSLAMRTRSIYAGFLLHITVAFGMDLLSLYKRGALPSKLWPS